MVKGAEYPHSKARDAREAEAIEALRTLVRARKDAGFSLSDVVQFITDKVVDFWQGRHEQNTQLRRAPWR